MIQEIITYMIIGSAVTIAFLKVRKKLSGKKKQQQIDYSKDSIKMQHDCSSCSAECMLRDATAPAIQSNKNICKKIELKSDQL